MFNAYIEVNRIGNGRVFSIMAFQSKIHGFEFSHRRSASSLSCYQLTAGLFLILIHAVVSLITEMKKGNGKNKHSYFRSSAKSFTKFDLPSTDKNTS